MLPANVSDDEKHNTFTLFKQLYCLSDTPDEIQGQLTFISALNAFLSITTFLGNVLIMVALRKESSLHPPSKLLLSNLATSDLCVGLIAEPLYISLLVTVVNKHWNICRYLAVACSATGYILSGVSLWTLTAKSVDRLFALLLGLRYKQVVSLKRVYFIIITFWVATTVVSAVRFFWNSPIISWYDIFVVSLCLLISTFSYTMIFFTLRNHQNQVQDLVQQPNQTNQLNIARYRKAVSTALWLQFTLVACYLPLVISLTFLLHAEPSSSVSIGFSYAVTLVLLNSSLNPILYCWRMKEVRHAVTDTIRQVFCSCSSR